MNKNIGASLKLGIIGGVAGGIIFGFLMQMMGRIEMIAGMMGSNSLLVGWLIHILISVMFGAAFGLLAVYIKNIWTLTILFSVGIWIAGPLVVMPMMMGMGTNLANAFSGEQLMSLATHLFFSVIVAIVYKAGLVRNTSKSAAA